MSSEAAADVSRISVDIAAAGPTSPASSMLSTATEASTVSGRYRKITADTVVIEDTNR